MKTYGEWKYSSTILDLGTRWRCFQFHAPATLKPGLKAPVSIGYKDVWAPGPDKSVDENSSCLCRESNRGRPSRSPWVSWPSFPGS
jgi:hypothetical protein